MSMAGCSPSCKRTPGASARAAGPRLRRESDAQRRKRMARLRLDALDRKIIAELQINSRLSVQE
ncbi:hypothetical protein, partial [Bosea sp. (in: a-proteobacteria)]|uniref:hypothetical protein n=1 Tax=Bosea sp. (in: a-proteobacteria) TaxID=1871050 RepID=UPI00334076A3